jgi:hypothetical protein
MLGVKGGIEMRLGVAGGGSKLPDFRKFVT